MEIKKFVRVLSVGAILGGFVSIGIPIDAKADINGYTIKVENEIYLYDKYEVMQDFLNYKIGNTAKLYNEFSDKLKKGNGFYAFKDSKKGYIDYGIIKKEFLKTKHENKVFNIEEFVQSKESKVMEVSWTKKAVVTKDGQIKYETPLNNDSDNKNNDAENKENGNNSTDSKDVVNNDNKTSENSTSSNHKHRHKHNSSSVVKENKEEKKSDVVQKDDKKDKEDKQKQEQLKKEQEEKIKAKQVEKEKQAQAEKQKEAEANQKEAQEKAKQEQLKKEQEEKIKAEQEEKEKQVKMEAEKVKQEQKAREEAERIEKENNRLIEEAKNNINLGNLTNIKSNLILPNKAANGVQITWKSSDESVIKNDGTVTIPSADKGDKKVTLTATFTKDSLTSTKVFEAIVKAEEKIQSDLNKDTMDKEISINSLKKDSEGNYIANNQEEFYCVVKDGLSKIQSSVVINLPNYKFGPKQSDGKSNPDPQYNLDIINEILIKDAGMDFGKPTSQSSIQGNGHTNKMTIKFNYKRDVNEVKRQKNATEAAVKKIIKEVIKPGMTDVEKELALHDYVVKHADYNMEGLKKNPADLEDHSAYGVLVLGKGVCESYAKAMHLLLNEVGVECKYVTGNKVEGKKIGGGHAWNIVKLEDGWYNLDATWDDPVSDRVVKPGEKNQSDNMLPVLHTYFNVSDDVFNKDHKRGDFEEKNYPKCTATKYSYDNLNVPEETSDGVLVEKVRNIRELDAKILAALQAKTSKVVLKLKNLNMDINALSTEVQKVCQDNKLNSGYSLSLQLAGDYLTYNFTF
ncbi:conserved hypothetical protein [Clostridium botulinum C str. Eklund]|nr:conserved hypothetical protein [Clostridium botulinum C str. Eklund]NEZ48115.1 transglutaminase domain-containing protein [Clostridium botulinum]